MKTLNNTEVNYATCIFWISFALLISLTYLPVYFFFKSCKAQNEYITQDLNNYKQLLNKHQLLKVKIDSLYNELALLNTGKVGSDLMLEKYIADNKNEVIKAIGTDSLTEFKHYALLVANIDNILKQKDTILQVTNKEQLASADLRECMNKTRKVKQDLSFDPTRNFSAAK